MAKIVNLRTIRKQKTRAKVQDLKKQRLDSLANISKPEISRVVSMNALDSRRLDGHERGSDD